MNKIMQVIEFEVSITGANEIHLQLPDYVNATWAKVIVMYNNENNEISLDEKQIE